MTEQAMITADFQQLIDRLADDSVDHDARAQIGDQLDRIGDRRAGVGLRSDGLPDTAWCRVNVPESSEGSPAAFKNERDQVYGNFALTPFVIAQYPVTVGQFQSFIDAPDGFQNDQWWDDLLARYQKQPILKARASHNNQPCDSVSWFQAVAFTRWLTVKCAGESIDQFVIGENAEIRLPLEWEWQFAAQGIDQRAYPWGAWNPRYANTREARLGRSTAVGMYPHGAAACGALDMSGSVWEWCLNEYHAPDHIRPNSYVARVLRGGSFADVADWALCGSRFNDLPNRRLDYFGFRVICGKFQPMNHDIKAL